jgi:large subunit ribosomal protein L10
MTKEDKNRTIDELAATLNSVPHFYIADIGGLTVEQTNALRRLCSKKNITLRTVKNTFLRKALERTGKDLSELYSVLEGPTSIFMTEVAPEPAKLIKDFRKKSDKPLLKGAFINAEIYVGDNLLDSLASLKSKEEVIGEIIGLLQSPAQRVISALQNQFKSEEVA